MSEVNQAFLRAYLKNRASQSTSTPGAPVTADQSETAQKMMASKPAVALPKVPSLPPTQPAQISPSGRKLRFDSAHSQPSHESETVAQPLPLPVRPAPRQGVWSPLGAERGMKALESTSVPAIVRNGVTAVTNEAAQYRRPTTTPTANQLPATQPSLPAHQAHHPPQAQRALPESSARIAYDQVMYVDGLSGHAPAGRMPTTRPTERTIAEITEPIAFGTGTQVPGSRHVQGVPSETSKKQIDTPKPGIERTTRRFDEPHRKSSIESVTSSPSISPPKTADKISPLNGKLPLPVEFYPSWEVDQFFWPEVVKHIESSNTDAFQQIGKHLSLANRDGLKVMAITSGERGVGRSTVAMHMARCAAAAGLRVALLDGDTFCPSLIDQLRLDMQQGWQDCLFENVPLHEIAIHSIADQITLFPLTSVISQQQMHANLHRISKLVRRISNAFDMVFIDASRINLEQRDLVGVAQESIVDAVIVVVDTELSIKEKVDSAVSILREMGISSIGLVENFQS